ncbi:MAG: hypothetical protein AB7P12_04680 [Alphaproteobacteria bacterium]
MYRSILFLAAIVVGVAMLAVAFDEWETIAGAARPLGFAIFSLV